MSMVSYILIFAFAFAFDCFAEFTYSDSLEEKIMSAVDVGCQ